MWTMAISSALSLLIYSQLAWLVIATTTTDPVDILIVGDDGIQRITPDNSSIVYEFNPMTNIKSIDYDAINDCVFMSNRSVIARKCTNKTIELLAQYGIGGKLHRDFNGDLAYDWMSEVLYFSDNGQLHGRRRIEAMEISARRPALEDAWRRTVIDFGVNQPLVTSLAVHPARGYLFWAQMNEEMAASGTGTIYRSNLDGSDVRTLLGPPYAIEPIQIAMDYGNDRLYWVDAVLKTVSSCDLNGKYYSNELDYTPGALAYNESRIAVHNGNIYWLEIKRLDGRTISASQIWTRNIAASRGSKEIILQKDEIFGNFRVFGNERLQSDSANACRDGRHNCSHLCVGMTNGQFACLCPDGLDMNHTVAMCECADGADELTCFRRTRPCPTGSFRCVADGECIHHA